jgi:hypothetical protein
MNFCADLGAGYAEYLNAEKTSISIIIVNYYGGSLLFRFFESQLILDSIKYPASEQIALLIRAIELVLSISIIALDQTPFSQALQLLHIIPTQQPPSTDLGCCTSRRLWC